MDKEKFKKISDQGERNKILKRLKMFTKDFYVHLSSGKRLDLKPGEYNAPSMVVFGEGIKIDHKVIVNFLEGKDLYFTRASLKTDGQGQGVLVFSKNLFLIQRRENFRVDVPSFRNMIFTTPCSHDMRVKNLSLGGALVAFKYELDSYRSRDCFDGQLKGGSLGAIEVSVQIKHISHLESGGVRWGIEFRNLSSGGSAKINQFIMSSYRHIFSKFSE